MIRKIRQITRNRKNRNFAIPAAAAAIPVNPNSAATKAITKKIAVQRNMFLPPLKRIAPARYHARSVQRARPGISLEAQPLLEEDSLAFDARTPTQEKIVQLRCVVITGVQRIEPKKNFAAWRQVSLQIAQKKIPFRRSPASLRRMIKIEID